jgi:hypothetical protein
MIKIFREIRKKLAAENKVAKYLRYAVGEILLIVIGILIALQVSNWNEYQKGKTEEEYILSNLNFESEKNLKLLTEHKRIYEESIHSCNLIMDLIGRPYKEIELYNPDSLISKVIDVFDYSPTQNVINELLSSGKMSLISSDSLKTALFEWSAGMNEKEEAWETIDQFTQLMFIPYLTKNASLKNIDRYGFLDWKDKSRLKTDHSFFNDIEFENNVDNQAWSLVFYTMQLDSLERTLNKIISLTNKYKG